MNVNKQPFGLTRTHVDSDHALIGPDSHVPSPLVNWKKTTGVILISPAMGGHPRGPRFVQYLAMTTSESETTGASEGVQRLIYVLDGSVSLDGVTLKTDDFAWLAPHEKYAINGQGEGKLLVFEKPYAPLASTEESLPPRIVSSFSKIAAEPFLGDPDAMLTTLLPISPAFDMAVNVFTYQSGATLPFVETHVMEHGLYMRSGQGVYRLGKKWYPVAKGDTIWMAAYCPQWFVAMGKESASYIYYKDIHRDPLASQDPLR
jgi:(S)-ureidoglycine aminohydrolase